MALGALFRTLKVPSRNTVHESFFVFIIHINFEVSVFARELDPLRKLSSLNSISISLLCVWDGWSRSVLTRLPYISMSCRLKGMTREKIREKIVFFPILFSVIENAKKETGNNGKYRQTSITIPRFQSMSYNRELRFFEHNVVKVGKGSD